jgi:hypothetical protein
MKFVVKNNSLKFTSSSPRSDSTNHVLKINNNGYGLKQAGNNWLTELRGFLLALGVWQSTNNPCLFVRSNCIIVVYVNDCLIFAKEDSILDSVVASL